MSAQTYTSVVAIQRLRQGLCPECGAEADAHGGWGGPGCTLTDNGVAQRVAAQADLDGRRFPEPRPMTPAEMRAEDEQERRLHDEAADDHENEWRTR